MKKILSFFIFALAGLPLTAMKRKAEKPLESHRRSRQRSTTDRRHINLASWIFGRKINPQKYPSRIFNSVKEIPGMHAIVTQEEAQRHVDGIKPRVGVPLLAVLSNACFELHLLFPARLQENPGAVCNIVNTSYWLVPGKGIYRADNDTFHTNIPTPDNPSHPDQYKGSLLDFAFFKGIDMHETGQSAFLSYIESLKKLANETCVTFCYNRETAESSLLHQLPKLIYQAGGQAWKRNALIDLYKYILRSSNPNLKDKDGATPLHQASYYGLNDLIELLKRRGARLDDLSNDGFSALGFAALENRTATIEQLLSIGAKKSTADIQAFCLQGDSFFDWFLQVEQQRRA